MEGGLCSGSVCILTVFSEDSQWPADSLLTTRDIALKIPLMLDASFPVEWLDAQHESDEQGRTNREVQFEARSFTSIITGPLTIIFSFTLIVYRAHVRKL